MSKEIIKIRDWIRTNGVFSEDGESITYDCKELEEIIDKALNLQVVGIELPTSKERISALENSIKYWYDEKNNRDIKEFSKGFDNCYRWIKDYVRKQR